jgi:hypothetical protein
LKNPDGDIRRNSATVLAGTGRIFETGAMQSDPAAVSALLAALKERDTDAIAGAFPFFLGRGDPGSEDGLVEALDKSGDRMMAEAFKACGNAMLEEAGRKWLATTNHPTRKTSFDAVDMFGFWWGIAQ